MSNIVVMGIFSIVAITIVLLMSKFERRKMLIIMLGATLSVVLAWLLFLPEFGYSQMFDFHIITHQYISWDILLIVFGMSLLVATLETTGVFDWITLKVIKFSVKVSRGQFTQIPTALLLLTFLLTFFMSAILDNVTAILLISSITVSTCRGLRINPKPLILGQIFATTLAGISTLISSLPAIMIGDAAGLTFFDFIFINTLFLLIAVPLSLVYFFRVFKNDLIPSEEDILDITFLLELDEWSVVENKRKFNFSIIILLLTVIGFVIAEQVHIPIGWVAIIGGVAALVFTKTNVDIILPEMHWDTMIFFIALFVLVGTLNTSGVLLVIAEVIIGFAQDNILFIVIELLFGAAMLDAIVANIPLTAALLPVVSNLTTSQPPEFSNLLWMILLYATAFGSAFTPIGSVTSVIGVKILKEEEYPVSFVAFGKLMAPLAVILLILGFGYLLGLQIIGYLPLF
ncbi:MAG: SLC13 family permease [Candidatus Hodarchaeota archaeon]